MGKKLATLPPLKHRYDSRDLNARPTLKLFGDLNASLLCLMHIVTFLSGTFCVPPWFNI